MNVKTRVKIPHTNVRNSVEVQHARRGTGLMLRRGLHGAKTWVLEAEDDGTPRGPWVKTGKAAIVLLPVWIALAPMTGSPQPGAQQVGVLQSIVTSLLVALGGLAWFSARERRLGREEPWLDLTSKTTESSQTASPATTTSGTGNPTGAFEKVQVSAAGQETGGPRARNDTGESDQSTRIGQPTLQWHAPQATSSEDATQVLDTLEPLSGVLHEPLRQAITQGANPEEVDPILPDSWMGDFKDPATMPHPTTPEWVSSQVNCDNDVLHGDPGQASILGTEKLDSGITDSDDSLLRDEPTVPLRESLRTVLRGEGSATPSSQVSPAITPVQQQLQGVLHGDYADRGPYEVTEGPIAEDWWLTSPDLPESGASEDATEPEEPPEEEPIVTPAGGAEVEAEAEAEAEAAPQWPLQRLPGQVLWFLAAQAPNAADETEKEAARVQVVGWLREETDAGRLTQAEAARVLGVNRSTISRWLNDDPWAQ